MGATRYGNKITVNQANKSSNNYYRIYIPDDRGHPTKLVSEANRKYNPRRRPWYVATAQAYRPIWIAALLFISLSTVKAYIRGIMNKLAFDDQVQAAVVALRTGLV